MGFSLVVESGTYSPVVMQRLLAEVASPVGEHGLQAVWASVVEAHGL